MRHWLRGACWFAAVLSLAMQASAQRQGANYRRQHLQKQAAPPASPAPATKPARVEDATATVAEPWSAARSKLIVSAESLTVATYHHETQSTEQDGVTTEVVQSGFSLNLLKGGEFILPFATTRLGASAMQCGQWSVVKPLIGACGSL